MMICAHAALTDRRGEGYVDTAVKILMADVYKRQQYDSASELVRHAIDFGYVWAEQGQGEAYWMDKWQAVLELEDCHRLDQALDFSQNLQHFAFIPRGVELGRFGFELAVKSGIIRCV